MVTAGMGGVLAEQAEPIRFERVLDVGCGTGSWIIEMAQTYPSIALLAGVDISGKMLAYARTRAEAAQVSARVEFHIMDVLRMLEFPDSFFDLVNQRSAASWLRTWDWPKLLQEYRRVCRPGGVVRITEAEWIMETSSPALSQLLDLWLQAFYQAGLSFTPTSDGVTSQLARLLHQHGLQDIQTHPYILEYRAGTPQGQSFMEDIALFLQTILPFLRKWTRVPADYESIRQQALIEMQQPDFVAYGKMLTAWGTNVPSTYVFISQPR
jgi:ubiquinone/menaquinone biosynthesis C-methylase UbiE